MSAVDTGAARQSGLDAIAHGERELAEYESPHDNAYIASMGRQIVALADALAAARADVATALDIDDRRVAQVREYRLRAEAAEAEVARLANELARYQTMTLHADHPSVVAAERDRLRDEVARLRAAMPPPSSLEAMAEWLAEGAPPKTEISAVQGRIREWSARIRSALDAGADTTGADDER